jgi:hypothetical protein
LPGTDKHKGKKKEQQHETDESLQAPAVISLPLNMFKVTSVVQQNHGHYKTCLIHHETKFITRINRPLKVIAFNVNGIGRQCYELRKELQDLHIDVALF